MPQENSPKVIVFIFYFFSFLGLCIGVPAVATYPAAVATAGSLTHCASQELSQHLSQGSRDVTDSLVP